MSRQAKRPRAGGGAAAGAAGQPQKKPYFDDLSEDLIGDVMRFLSVRDLDVARFPCKVFNLVAQRFVAWIGVAPAAAGGSSAGGGASGGLPAHMKRNLQEALVAFERFRAAHPGGRVLEIRLTDHVSHTTGWEVGTSWGRVAGKIGGGDYRGLQLDGENRWRGLRNVTPGRAIWGREPVLGFCTSGPHPRYLLPLADRRAQRCSVGQFFGGNFFGDWPLVLELITH